MVMVRVLRKSNGLNSVAFKKNCHKIHNNGNHVTW